MIGRRLIAIALAVPLTACAATATQTWRTAPELAAPVWNFRGIQGAWGRTAITINEQPVLEGKVSIWTGAGELSGLYEGKSVVAKCKKSSGAQVRTQCAINVDGRKATTLYFRVK